MTQSELLPAEYRQQAERVPIQKTLGGISLGCSMICGWKPGRKRRRNVSCSCWIRCQKLRNRIGDC